MSQKRKSGLQTGLVEIVEKQTAPVADKSKLSKGLIGQFRDESPTVSTQGTQSTKRTQSTIAPARDFTRTANSIVRQAVPAGLFKGKCKQLYDFLYSKTRGAIVPTRTVRLTRGAIMKGSDTRSTKTLFINLNHLKTVGLVRVGGHNGEHEGNEYEVLLPEEITTLSTQGTYGTQSAPSHDLPTVPMVETTLSTQGVTPTTSDLSNDPKTSFKTKDQDDDEAFPELRKVERELTGTTSAIRAWSELDSLLASELRLAGSRTNNVVSAPGFLAEHLRRRLSKPEPAQVKSASKATHTEPVNTRSEPMTREEALKLWDESADVPTTRAMLEADYPEYFKDREGD
jgi:hypothetical protein